MTRAPLMRMSAIHLPDGDVQMIWTFHHLLIDGWCLPLIFTEVMAGYEALRNGVEMLVTPATPYRRFIDWLARRDETNDRAFWTGLLAGFAGPRPSPATRKAALMSRAGPVCGGFHAPKPKQSARWARTGI